MMPLHSCECGEQYRRELDALRARVADLEAGQKVADGVVLAFAFMRDGAIVIEPTDDLLMMLTDGSVSLCAATPSKVADGVVRGAEFYLASFKNCRSKGFVTWWGPANAGYTPYLEQAGIYKASEIRKGYHDSDETVPVPVEYARQIAVRCIDVGHTAAYPFYCASTLRAILAAQQQKVKP